MKKLALVLISVTVAILSFALSGCSDDGTKFTSKSYSSLDSIIKTITIDVSDREIEVTSSKDNNVYINYFESEKEYYEISVSEDNALTMTLLHNKKWTDYIGIKPSASDRKINLQIPNSLLSSLEISTTNAIIKVSQISVIDKISLSSTDGNIDLENIDAGNEIIISSKNGNINGTILGSYDDFSIKCEIKKGDCNLPQSKPDGKKSLKLTCNNGNINIDFNKLSALKV